MGIPWRAWSCQASMARGRRGWKQNELPVIGSVASNQSHRAGISTRLACCQDQLDVAGLTLLAKRQTKMTIQLCFLLIADSSLCAGPLLRAFVQLLISLWRRSGQCSDFARLPLHTSESENKFVFHGTLWLQTRYCLL